MRRRGTTAGRQLLLANGWSRCCGGESAYGLLAYDEAGLCGLVVGDEEQFYDEVQFQIREFCVDNSRRGQGLGTMIY